MITHDSSLMLGCLHPLNKAAFFQGKGEMMTYWLLSQMENKVDKRAHFETENSNIPPDVVTKHAIGHLA